TATGQAVGMVRMLAESPKGGVWIVHTSSGDVRSVTLQSPKIHIPDEEPMCLVFDGDRSLWIGLSKGGLRRAADLENAQASALEPLQINDQLTNGMVYSTFKDLEGNLWFGSAGGLDRFRENKATPFSAKEGLIPDKNMAV